MTLKVVSKYLEEPSQLNWKQIVHDTSSSLKRAGRVVVLDSQ